MTRIFHQSVLVSKVLEFLKVEKNEKYIDATVGSGGVTQEIIRRGGKVLGIDWDEEVVDFLNKRFVKEIRQGQLILENENFAKIAEIAKRNNFIPCSGIVFDLGVSQYQLQTKERGFSFHKVGPLDMRMSKKLAVTAKDLLSVLTQRELTRLFAEFSEPKARIIAEEIVAFRDKKPIETTEQLADLVRGVVKTKKTHPATKVFLALRVAVNSELENLGQALIGAVSILKKGGRLLAISFHSAEDGIVKDFFRHSKNLAILTTKPITPTEEEVRHNPQARSARLRVAERRE